MSLAIVVVVGCCESPPRVGQEGLAARFCKCPNTECATGNREEFRNCRLADLVAIDAVSSWNRARSRKGHQKGKRRNEKVVVVGRDWEWQSRSRGGWERVPLSCNQPPGLSGPSGAQRRIGWYNVHMHPPCEQDGVVCESPIPLGHIQQVTNVSHQAGHGARAKPGCTGLALRVMPVVVTYPK